MKRAFVVLLAIFTLFIIAAPSARAGIDIFLADLNVRANADLPGFSSSLSAQFNVPMPKVGIVMKSVNNPADAFMCFQLSMMTGIHIDRVLHVYRENAPQGWGVIAKELGIKPGSEAFHALKNGEFDFFGVRGRKTETKSEKGPGKGKGRGKGHKK